MTDQARLLDGSFSEGLETVTSLVRCSEFSADLGKSIRQPGGAERAVLALRREFLPQPQIVTENGNGGPYRESGGLVLPPDHYLVPCGYGKLPSMADLRKTYTGGVSGIFDGRAWKKYSLRVRADVRPGNRIMVLKYFAQEMESEDVIAWGLDNNLVPAMGHNEALDFRKTNPKLQLEFPIVSLGSFALGDGSGRCVAVLRAFGGEPWLGGGWFVSRWDADCRFLFLSK